MVKHISKKKIKIDLCQLKRLGIDEIALKKGQGQYIVVLVNLDTNKPVGFVRSRKQLDIREVLASWGTQVLEQITEVSMDMSGNYKGLVTDLLPNADITVDRFHVMKVVNEELDAARRDVKKPQNHCQMLQQKSNLKQLYTKVVLAEVRK